MLFLLAKRKPCSAILTLFSADHSRCLCSASAITHNPLPNFSLDDYLMATFGFSPEKAARISKPIAHLKSSDNPAAVCRLLHNQGFSESHINKLVTWCPKILCSRPEKTIAPNLGALRDIGLSNSVLTQLILSGPAALYSGYAVPRIKFWRDFFGGDEVALVKAFKNNSGIIGHDIDRVIMPKISLLQSHGLSTVHIQKIILTVRQFITRSASLMEELLNRTKELGFQSESGMFVSALEAMTWTSRKVIQKKMELLKSFGWSENEFHSALQKCPTFILLTEENLRMKMNFLVGEVGCDPSYIASVPVILKYSLEKRLKPRQHVLHLLESKDISAKTHVSITMNFSNNRFVEKYILPHEKEVPGLHEFLKQSVCGEIYTSPREGGSRTS